MHVQIAGQHAAVSATPGQAPGEGEGEGDGTTSCTPAPERGQQLPAPGRRVTFDTDFQFP